jgi:hypothetical protein
VYRRFIGAYCLYHQGDRRRYIPEDSKLHIRSRESLKSHMTCYMFCFRVLYQTAFHNYVILNVTHYRTSTKCTTENSTKKQACRPTEVKFKSDYVHRHAIDYNLPLNIRVKVTLTARPLLTPAAQKLYTEHMVYSRVERLFTPEHCLASKSLGADRGANMKCVL